MALTSASSGATLFLMHSDWSSSVVGYRGLHVYVPEPSPAPIPPQTCGSGTCCPNQGHSMTPVIATRSGVFSVLVQGMLTICSLPWGVGHNLARFSFLLLPKRMLRSCFSIAVMWRVFPCSECVNVGCISRFKL